MPSPNVAFRTEERLWRLIEERAKSGILLGPRRTA
jgi:hypothetical protein